MIAPAYCRLIKKLKKGDLLVVKSIDRLGRNYEEILDQWRVITKIKQVDIFVIDFPLLDTRKKKIILQECLLLILSCRFCLMLHRQRELIRQRQAKGVAAAKRRWVKFGKSKQELPENFWDASVRYQSGELTVGQATDMCGMKYSTFYKHFRLIENEPDNG